MLNINSKAIAIKFKVFLSPVGGDCSVRLITYFQIVLNNSKMWYGGNMSKILLKKL